VANPTRLSLKRHSLTVKCTNQKRTTYKLIKPTMQRATALSHLIIHPKYNGQFSTRRRRRNAAEWIKMLKRQKQISVELSYKLDLHTYFRKKKGFLSLPSAGICNIRIYNNERFSTVANHPCKIGVRCTSMPSWSTINGKDQLDMCHTCR